MLIFQDFHSKRFTTLTDHFWCIFVTFSRVGIFVTFCWFSVETMSRWRRLIIATFQQTCPNPFEDTRAQNIERAASAIQLWGWRPQCDQIGLFFKFLAKKLSYKSSQNIWYLFWKINFQVKTAAPTFGASLKEFGLILSQHLVTLVEQFRRTPRSLLRPNIVNTVTTQKKLRKLKFNKFYQSSF